MTNITQTYFNSFFDSIGEDLTREGLQDTPKRVENLKNEIYVGYSKDPHIELGATFNNTKNDEMIIAKNIEFFSMCEHHLLPFFGVAHIGYIPQDKIAGISGLAKLVDVYAKRLQIQENLTLQIATTLMESLNPKGVVVVIKARHLCMEMRGVEKKSEIITSALRGIFKSDPKTRAEFMGLIG